MCRILRGILVTRAMDIWVTVINKNIDNSIQTYIEKTRLENNYR